MTAEPHPQRCDDSCPCRTPVCEETCPEYQFQERFSIWLATHHDLSIEKHRDIVGNASLIFDDLCSSSPAKSERDIEQLKKAIIEVLDTGFESSERDMALVLDRIDAWEKGTLIKKTSQWGDGNPRLQCRNPDGTLRKQGEQR